MTTELGGTASFGVVLDTQPTADVTITLSLSDRTEGTVSPSSLTFSPASWNVARTVTVTGVDDLVDDGDVNYTILTAANSTDPGYDELAVDDVTVSNVDNDTQALVVTPTTLSVNEGGTNTFTVKLAAQPLSDVTVTVAHQSGDADLSVSGGSSLTLYQRQLEHGADGDGRGGRGRGRGPRHGHDPGLVGRPDARGRDGQRSGQRHAGVGRDADDAVGERRRDEHVHGQAGGPAAERRDGDGGPPERRRGPERHRRRRR